MVEDRSPLVHELLVLDRLAHGGIEDLVFELRVNPELVADHAEHERAKHLGGQMRERKAALAGGDGGAMIGRMSELADASRS
jgi:hypothetical protein